MSFRILAFVFLCFLAACDPNTEDLRQKSDAMAASARMHSVEVAAGEFTLLVYERIENPAAPVRVYIEGDGKAWLTRNEVSPDPTPTEPVALTLAIRDPSPNVAYMARACQYITSPACNPAYWTSALYNESVIRSADSVLGRWRGHSISLVGYSGGAGLAMLLAARRNDISQIRTVAGNIDIAAFTALHHVTPFNRSLNPADNAARTANIPQLHFVGEKDQVIPPSLINRYQNALPAVHCSAYEIVPGQNHYSGWAERWPELLAHPLPCALPTS